MPAIQTPRTHGHPADTIAGKPAPTDPAPAVGAGLPAMQTPRTHGHHADAIAGKPAPTEPAPTVGAGLPAMQAPRPHGHPADPIAGKPAPTVGAGLARDADAAHSRTPRRHHRRQACSNRASANCRSRACPRYKRRALTDTPPTPSQASQLQQSPRQLWERACPRCRRRALTATRRHHRRQPAPTQTEQPYLASSISLPLASIALVEG